VSVSLREQPAVRLTGSRTCGIISRRSAWQGYAMPRSKRLGYWNILHLPWPQAVRINLPRLLS
jgi:hypothetical protein